MILRRKGRSICICGNSCSQCTLVFKHFVIIVLALSYHSLHAWLCLLGSTQRHCDPSRPGHHSCLAQFPGANVTLLLLPDHPATLLVVNLEGSRVSQAV